MSAWDTAKNMTARWSLLGLIMDHVDKANGAVDAAADQGIEKLSEELAKQELRMKFELQQSKIAQEVAIAQRILNAEIVEIEEFYDTSGSGTAGLSATAESMTLGLSIEGKRVTKRIYQFKGGQSPAMAEGAGRGGSEQANLRAPGPVLP